ncbi:MAG TPA: hypothetical protein VG935_04770, partial [Patescibacteria group bacterium]|nr:hypothetical protein [Patescibacteria group bacterium]
MPDSNPVSSPVVQQPVSSLPQPALQVQSPRAAQPEPAAQLDDQDVSLLDVLLTEKVLTQDQANTVKIKSAQEGKSADVVLRELKMIPDDKIAEAKARVLGVPYISLATTSFSPQAISLLPRAVVERFSLIPFFYDEQAQTISIAMANPVDLDAIEFVRQKTGLSVKAFAAAPSEV